MKINISNSNEVEQYVDKSTKNQQRNSTIKFYSLFSQTPSFFGVKGIVH